MRKAIIVLLFGLGALLSAFLVPTTRNEIYWLHASVSGSVDGYQNYLSANPHGRQLAEARERILALRSDLSLYEEAVRNGSDSSLSRFLSRYPGHKKEAEAQTALTELRVGRDIVDLLQEKKIEVQAQGQAIDKITLRIRRVVSYPLSVRIPVGTFFVSSRRSAQDMVATSETKTRLTNSDWITVYPAVACANRPKDIPGTNDTFSVARSPNQAELVRLMPVLDRAKVGTYTRQAAVWIVTDNANYDELGALVVSHGPVVIPGLGTRAIGYEDAVRAMKICDEAGIDITRKAIWRDRTRLLAGARPGEFKTWLEQKK